MCSHGLASDAQMSIDRFEVISELSGGSCSRVDLVKDKASTEKWVRKVVSTDDMHPASLKLLKAEVDLLTALDHPNIMGLREHMEDTEGSQFVTILEYIPGITCEAFLCKHEDPLDECLVAGIISQVFAALSHCHAKNVIHRDVKPDNIIIAPDKKCGYHVTLIDFGCAAANKEGGLQQAAGTQAYMAPDMLVGSPQYDAKVDVWSCGATAYEMLTGKPPFGHPADHDGDDRKIARKIRSYRRSAQPEAELAAAPRWGELSVEAQDFLKNVLSADPHSRPSAVEAVEHPWISMNRKLRTARYSSPKKGGA